MSEAEQQETSCQEDCVICLERLTERATALPCKHDQFDFGCLGTWLNQQRVCPLCKSIVTAVEYDLSKDGGSVFVLPPPESGDPRYHRPHPYIPTGRHRITASHRRPDGVGRTTVYRGGRVQVPASLHDPIIAFRRRVYRTNSYSLRVGSNNISRHQNLTPSCFTSNKALVPRAKSWIRRELSAFDFLDPDSDLYGDSDRRTSNAEFLLEYIISILKSIDIRGSSGQAEALLKDFFGQAKARLFLHELEAFLRSPYERLEDWDAHVQYSDSNASENRCPKEHEASQPIDAT